MMPLNENYVATMDAIAKRIIEAGVAGPDEVIGCSSDETQSLESTWGCALPEMYRAFLAKMGRGAGRFFRGTDLFYPKALQLKAWTQILLEEDKAGFQIPPDAVTFLMHQGYQFMYFQRSDGGNDPAVYHYMEGDGTSRRISP